jgi:HD-GYP domain-containing protein (c-di-GMP phosphodiesterase class II)
MRTTLNAVISVAPRLWGAVGLTGESRADAKIRALEERLGQTHWPTLLHGRRLEDPVRRTCLALGLPPEHADSVGRAAVLHDIGKVEISLEILDKPGPLTEAEFAEIKRHSELGAGILVGAGQHRWGRWVRYHHERIGGGGYPLGIAGSRIPIESRVIAVADAFDAMVAGGEGARPYRAPMEPKSAIAELNRCSGEQFDPAVVDAFCRVGLD